ncbi:MAG TPA: hypothetical protein VG892_07725 [Terriglobales bacterium]|nr:hypothetical protein [Terriglobales bacterium]
MEFKIEPGIPIPAHARTVYPFKEMKIGDSFFVSDEIAQGIRNAAQKEIFCKASKRWLSLLEG